MGDDVLLLVGATGDGVGLLGRVIRPRTREGAFIWEVPDGSVGGVTTTQLTAMRALEGAV